MTFAHWTNTLANPGLADAEEFVTGIPEGTSRDEVVASLINCGASIGETDKLGFEEEWPPEIRRQFLDPHSDATRWSWADLVSRRAGGPA